MSKDPAFLFYTSDFLTGTMLMTDEQVGKYIRLLCLQHQMGKLSEKHMLNICKSYDSDIFEKFAKDDDGNYYNLRLNDEISKRNAYSESRRNNRKASNAKPVRLKKHMSNICKSYDEHMENENINENEIIIRDKQVITELFNQFYSKYPKKIAKQEAVKSFGKIELSKALFATIMASLEKWKAADDWTKDGGQFVPYPATWLNGKRWEDEPPKAKTQSKPKYKPNNIGNFTGREYSDDELNGFYEEVPRVT